jgi:nucleolar protein 53
MNKMKSKAKNKSAFGKVEKQTKKSTKGKKNWRKNIDVSEIERNINLDGQIKLVDKNLQLAKDADLFTIDLDPLIKGKKNLINKKNNLKQKKISKVEERKIKRIAENINTNEIKEETNKIMKDLWEDETDIKSSNKISFPRTQFTFPKVPLPHPGQSYNPSKDDLTKLFHKIVDLNKKQEIKEPEQNQIKPEEKVYYEDSDAEDEENEKVENYVANNPAINDTDRLTKKEKKRRIQAKLNRIKDREMINQKKNRIVLAHEKSLKRLEKEQEKNIKAAELLKKKDIEMKKTKQELLLCGIVEE